MVQINTNKKIQTVSDINRLINAIEKYGILRLNVEHVSLTRSEFEVVKNRYIDNMLSIDSNIEGDTIYTFYSFAKVDCNKIHLYTKECTIYVEKQSFEPYSMNVLRVLNGLDWL